MRCSREVWLKSLCAAVVSLAAVPASAQFFAPLALVADADDDARPHNFDYWIGVRCAELPALLRAQLDLPEGHGVLIDEVVADSPAQRAGLKAYDVIFAVDGKPVADPQALAGAVGRSEDREVKIEYLRAGRKESVTVKPEKRPEAIGPQQEDQRSIRQWLEKLGRGPAPMNFRLWHPGMVVPPGVSIAPPLPDDMTVTVEKQGNKPAKVSVKQGGKNWEADEDSLDKLPADARQFAERMLGLGGFDLAESDARRMPQRPGPQPNAWTAQPRDPESRLNKRLDEMNRQIDDLRKSIEKLQSK